jgi:predicted glycosyltransferase
VLTGSRAATLSARRLGIPSFVIIDYEYVNLGIYAVSGSHILHPAVIPARVFRRRGIRRTQLLPFAGLKEDISFDGLDLDAVPPYEFPQSDPAELRVLFRPPAEDSHYYRSESGELALELLRHLAGRDVRVIFSPRYERQRSYLDSVNVWRRQPILLQEPVPFVPLLKGVDAVFSAGGTMVREAAYLGVPSYSMFRGRAGAVDKDLASIGRLKLVSSAADFSRIELTTSRTISRLRPTSNTAEAVMEMMLAHVDDGAGAQEQTRHAA